MLSRLNHRHDINRRGNCRNIYLPLSRAPALARRSQSSRALAVAIGPREIESLCSAGIFGMTLCSDAGGLRRYHLQINNRRRRFSKNKCGLRLQLREADLKLTPLSCAMTTQRHAVERGYAVFARYVRANIANLREP